MGRYVALVLSFDQPYRERDALAGALDCGVFRPHSLGCQGNNPDGGPGRDWFLAGSALEHLTRSPSARVSEGNGCRFYYPEPITDDAREYFEHIERALKNGESLANELSPAESLDNQLGVTCVTSPPLRQATIEQGEKRLFASKERSFELFGDFLVQEGGSSIQGGTFAFRFTHETEREVVLRSPVLQVTARSNAMDAGVTTVSLHSSSSIWLQQDDALGGLVTSDNADANLEQFRQLAESIIAHADMRLRESLLLLQGKSFFREQERFLAACEGIRRESERWLTEFG